MAAKVAKVRVVMGGEVADAVIYLGGGVDDGLGVMRKLCNVDAVLLGFELLGVFAIL